MFFYSINISITIMKTQILPNWGKRLGLSVFILATLLNGGINFFSTRTNSDNGILGLLNAFSGGALFYSINFIAIVGMLLYMLSREKIEDDYINKLRLESFQLTFIISLVLTIIIYALNINIKLTLDYFIFPLLGTFLIIFFIKRKICL